ncbi:MAG TPA: tetraacyldisaccharide 4'-kinase [Woeseiaceae bacterium]
MSSRRAYTWLHRAWYEGAALGWLLLPLSAIFWLLSSLRRLLYANQLLRVYRAEVPVIVVGNVTAGGAGKTPTVLWLVEQLKRRGFRPGIVSRGYGGSRADTSMRVEADSDPAVVGDEPVLLARRSACPVVVDPDRARAAQMLVEDGADVIVADDGLQHYRLGRDYEICVIDGARGLGNRHLLPAGPLRESPERLASVDQVLVNGGWGDGKTALSAPEQNAIPFRLAATDACRLNGSLSRPLARFEGETVHAVAAIGNPDRFFRLLQEFGIEVVAHACPDHAPLTRSDVDFGDERPVFMTEKDAVKLDTGLDDRYWYVPVSLDMDPALAGPLLAQIESRLNSVRIAQ